MQRNHIRLSEDFIHSGAALDTVLVGEFFIPVWIEGDDRHAEGFGANGDLFANATEANDPHGLVGDFVTRQAQPFATARGSSGGDDVLGDADE